MFGTGKLKLTELICNARAGSKDLGKYLIFARTMTRFSKHRFIEKGVHRKAGAFNHAFKLRAPVFGRAV